MCLTHHTAYFKVSTSALVFRVDFVKSSVVSATALVSVKGFILNQASALELL